MKSKYYDEPLPRRLVNAKRCHRASLSRYKNRAVTEQKGSAQSRHAVVTQCGSIEAAFNQAAKSATQSNQQRNQDTGAPTPSVREIRSTPSLAQLYVSHGFRAALTQIGCSFQERCHAFPFFQNSLSCMRFGRISQRDAGNTRWRAAGKLAQLCSPPVSSRQT